MSRNSLKMQNKNRTVETDFSCIYDQRIREKHKTKYKM